MTRKSPGIGLFWPGTGIRNWVSRDQEFASSLAGLGCEYRDFHEKSQKLQTQVGRFGYIYSSRPSHTSPRAYLMADALILLNRQSWRLIWPEQLLASLSTWRLHLIKTLRTSGRTRSAKRNYHHSNAPMFTSQSPQRISTQPIDLFNPLAALVWLK